MTLPPRLALDLEIKFCFDDFGHLVAAEVVFKS